MLNDFVCTGQLVEELSRLRQAYGLLEDIYAYRNTPNLKGLLDEVEEFFEEVKNDH